MRVDQAVFDAQKPENIADLANRPDLRIANLLKS
jgi:hypothetical protein